MDKSVHYKIAKSAKGSVRAVLEHMNPISDPKELLEYVFYRFTPKERVVVAAGGFVFDSQNNLQFLMPSTARVIHYLSNGVERFDKGYAKLAVNVVENESDEYRHIITNKYEMFSDQLIAEKKNKEYEECKDIANDVEDDCESQDEGVFEDI